MQVLQGQRHGLTKLMADSSSLCEMVGSTCALAEHVSSKVRELDGAKSRLQDTIQVVASIIDLRACVDGLQDAMDRANYEEAAGHIHRFVAFVLARLKHASRCLRGDAPASEPRCYSPSHAAACAWCNCDVKVLNNGQGAAEGRNWSCGGRQRQH